MFNIDWNEVIKSTPATVRAAVIIVLLGLVVMLTTVLSFAVWKGQAFKGFGVELAEYRDPDVQRCRELIAAFPVTNSVNSDGLNLRGTQISELLAMSERYFKLEAELLTKSAPDTLLDRYRSEAKASIERADALRVDQQKIIESRAKLLATITANCSRVPGTN